MAQQEDKLALSKKGKREMSPFIGHELLYDYLSGVLDEERKLAVEDHVKFSRDAQLDLNKIQNGEIYAKQLASTIVSQPIIEQINTPSTYLTVLMQKSNFDRWPQGLKWGLEALVVVGVIVTLLTVAPWQKVLQIGMSGGSKEVVLSEVSKTEKVAQYEDKPQFVDEEPKTDKPLQVPKPMPTAEVKASPAATVAAKPSVAPATTVAAAAATAKKEAEKEDESSSVASGGFLYRGEIALTNLSVVGPKITEKIQELGGRKAGSVELGWQKSPTSTYYHFTLPEAKYQDLTTFLGTYGKVNLIKEKHPRVMPDGIIRLIITVDEDKK
ncbi:zf-HC2 domain-containing protein [Bdellovibrio sp. HCB274]|uniref:zf-HC2 domain-containing protein n=1 Tax=Bdellovibrio sp. HCB274 TaxID=3394361 RepID=UPI0039B6B90E